MEESSKAAQCPTENQVLTDYGVSTSKDTITDELGTSVDESATIVQAVSDVASDQSMQPEQEPESTTTYSQLRINAVIMGTIGSGKATLANRIANEDIFKPQDDFVRAPEVRFGKSKSDAFAFLLIDTFGPFQVKNYREYYSYQFLQKKFKDHMREGVNVIIATIRKGCSSPDEIKVLNYIIRKRFSKTANEYFVLVITACEEVGFSKRNEFLRSMHQTTEDTKYIFAYAIKYKGVYMTAFPDVDKVDDMDTKAAYRKKIEHSKAELQEILKSCKTQLYFEEIFGEVNAKDKKTWSLLPSKEVASACTQS